MICAHDATVHDVFLSRLWNFWFCEERDGFGCCGKSADFFAEGLTPYFFVFWVLEQMSVF
jgi:hypothetical protein